MEKLKTYYKVFFGILIILMSSCIKDDGTSFSRNNDEESDVTSSLAMITTLNYFKINNLTAAETDCCFAFEYPIMFYYNTGVTMQVYNYQGLLDAIKTQDISFNITGTQFPIKFKPQNSTITFLINDDKELTELLEACQIATLRNDFDTLNNQCFKIQFPIILYDNNNIEVSVKDNQSLDSLLINLGENYQPNLKFPIDLLVAPDFTKITVSSYYELYAIINSCVRCPKASYTIESLPSNEYKFTPNFELGEGEEVVFTINDTIVEDQIIDGSVFIRSFTPGVYDVCFEITSPSCKEGDKACTQLVVNPSVCITDSDVDFAFVPLTLNEYQFIPRPLPQFVTESNGYIASFLINDVIIPDQPIDEGPFTRYFTPGSYNVCMQVVTSGCVNVVKTCKLIVVDPICPTLSFTYQQDLYGGPNSYQFTRSISGQVEGSELIEWYLNGSLVKSELQTTTNTFIDLIPGVNTVCAKIITEWCPDGIEYCDYITIP